MRFPYNTGSHSNTDVLRTHLLDQKRFLVLANREKRKKEQTNVFIMINSHALIFTNL